MGSLFVQPPHACTSPVHVSPTGCNAFLLCARRVAVRFVHGVSASHEEGYLIHCRPRASCRHTACA